MCWVVFCLFQVQTSQVRHYFQKNISLTHLSVKCIIVPHFLLEYRFDMYIINQITYSVVIIVISFQISNAQRWHFQQLIVLIQYALGFKQILFLPLAYIILQY